MCTIRLTKVTSRNIMAARPSMRIPASKPASPANAVSWNPRSTRNGSTPAGTSTASAPSAASTDRSPVAMARRWPSSAAWSPPAALSPSCAASTCATASTLAENTSTATNTDMTSARATAVMPTSAPCLGNCLPKNTMIAPEANITAGITQANSEIICVPLELHQVGVVDVDRSAVAVHEQDDRQADAHLGGAHGQHEQREDLSGQHRVADALGGDGAEGHEVDRDRGEHELDAHQHQHGVAARQHAEDADAEQQGREHQRERGLHQADTSRAARPGPGWEVASEGTGVARPVRRSASTSGSGPSPSSLRARMMAPIRATVRKKPRTMNGKAQ